MKFLILIFSVITFLEADAKPPTTLTLKEVRLFVDSFLDIPDTPKIAGDKMIKATWFISNTQGVIDGLQLADAILKPKKPILQHLPLNQTKVFRDFRAYLIKSPNLADDSHGYNIFISFLLNNYTDNIGSKSKALSLLIKEIPRKKMQNKSQ